ncbi:MAG: ABC transporter permease subunit, partial [Pseudomonadota bacterium]
MTTISTNENPLGRSPRKTPRGLAFSALVVAALCVLPMLAVALAALLGGLDTIGQLWQSVLPRYTGNTALLVVLVAAGTFMLGTGAAWLVTMTRFPGVRFFEVALVLPLAFPAYVLAYAYTHVLDHPGIVQTTLRAFTGWGPRDYWFPEIRSLGGAAIMLVLVLYPYVYLLARASFLQQSGSTFMAARALGSRPIGAFFRVSLPLARPAIAAGVLLAVMETIADFGTVAYFGVQTFATGIYTSWFTLADRAGAAQLALCLLAFALVLAVLERAQRGEAKYHDPARGQKRQAPLSLEGWFAGCAVVLC